MYHFSESDLNIKSVAQLKDVYVQLGCTEVITDKRIKANWLQAILTHQSALVEKVTVAEVAQLLLQPKIEEQSTQYQDLLDQINHIRYAWEDSRDECINYEDGELWFATPESNIYVLWELDKNEADVVNEILSKTSTPAVVEEQPKTCATCPLFKPFGDGTGRGLCCGSDTVSRDHHLQTGDCLHMIEDAKSVGQQLLSDRLRAANNKSEHFPQGQTTASNLKEVFPQGQQAASNLTENLREARRIEYSIRQTSPEGNQLSISTNVQSGLLIFKPARCTGAYEVWNGDVKYGVIRMLEDGLWMHSYAPVTAKCGTPYESAAALIEAVQLRQTRSQDIEVLERWDDKFVVRNIQNGCHYVVQPNHPDPKERCECGDCHFRSVICKHQIAVSDHTQIESLSDDIEVDSVSDPDFGLLYRVWKSWELLGTFYHALDSKWVAQPCESDAGPRCETANQAQLLILAMAGMLVAGEVEEDLEVPVVCKINLTEARLDTEKAVTNNLFKYQAQAAVLFPDTQQTSTAIKRLQNLDTKRLKLLGGDTLYSKMTLTEGRNDVEGLIIAVPWFRETQQSKNFAQTAAKQWGGAINWRTATSFDATQAFIQALSSSSNPSRSTVLQKLKDVKLSSSETSGDILQFTSDGKRVSKPILVKVKGGQFVLVK